ncbi:MAG: hypothetical protein JWM87_1180 [Candidatus Eremiobacteraeota bacterium]|nr:hypothetical protein [Candidatus Eremiobacteraeota bacterium]
MELWTRWKGHFGEAFQKAALVNTVVTLVLNAEKIVHAILRMTGHA